MVVLKLDFEAIMYLIFPIMAIVIALGCTGNWLLAALALVISLSAMVVFKLSRNNEKI